MLDHFKMSIVTEEEELQVNFAHAIPFPESDCYLYPFGIFDEQIFQYTFDTLVENIIPGYLAISVNCALARILRKIARQYHCVDIQQYDKILLTNPNHQHTNQTITMTNSLLVHFIGIYCSPNSRHLLLQII